MLASIGVQSKGRSGKQKFGKDPFSKQEKRQVSEKQEEVYDYLFHLQRCLLLYQNKFLSMHFLMFFNCLVLVSYSIFTHYVQ